MGLSNKSGRHVTYVSVANGKFKVKSKEGVDGAISRVNKKGDTVWEVPYSDLSGFITGIEISKFTFQGAENESLELTVEDEGQSYVVQCIFGSSSCKSFLARAENIDFTNEVTLSAFEYTQVIKGDERTSTYMVPKQMGENISAIYGMPDKGLIAWPPLKEIERNRKKEWDKTDLLNEMEAIVARLKVKLEREAKQAVMMPPSEGGRYDAPVAHKQEPGKYNPAGDDFDKPSAVADAVNKGGEQDFNDDLPF